MTAEDDAYRAAEALIAKAKAEGATTLSFNTRETRALTRLPPEIADLPALRTLDLQKTQISDFAPLAAMTGLTSLSLVITRITDLAPLAVLTGLTTLSLSNTQITDITPLTALTGLSGLWLANTQIADFAPLAALTGLTTLSLSDTQITDLAPLAAMTRLTTLYLGSTQIADFAPLAAMTGLGELHLDNTRITDLAPLAATTRLNTLWLSNTRITDFAPLASMTSLTTLWLNNTQIADLTPLTAMTRLHTLYLHNTRITDLAPLAAMTGLTRLYLGDTRITDLAPLAALTGLAMLSLDNTEIADLRPLRGLTELTDHPFATGLTFQNTPATSTDPRIAEIAGIKDPDSRAGALFDYLETWEPPVEVAVPTVPERVPAPLETEIRDDVLAVLVPADPPLPPGPVDTRARVGWQELRSFRTDFEGALNIANYRPLASAIGAFDRAMGASYDTMNEVGVGLSGLRLSALASDSDFVATLPDGAGTELGTLASAITTFVNRFPEWLAYLSDPEHAVPVAAAVQDSLPVFDAIARALEQAEDVEPAVIAEYRDEVELVRTAPESEVAAHAVLASTRDLLRTLSENALIGFRLYLDAMKQTATAVGSRTARFVANEAKEFAKIIPSEARKGVFWTVLGVTSDILFLKGGVMMSLATKFPETLGWLATVLRYFGVVP